MTKVFHLADQPLLSNEHLKYDKGLPFCWSTFIIQQTLNLRQPKLDYEYGHIYKPNQTEQNPLASSYNIVRQEFFI